MLLCGLTPVNFQHFLNIIRAAINHSLTVQTLLTELGVFDEINKLTAQAVALANQALGQLVQAAMSIIQDALKAVFDVIAPIIKALEDALQEMFDTAFASLNGLLGCTTEQVVKHSVLLPLPPFPADLFSVGLKAMLNILVSPKLPLMLLGIAIQGIEAITAGIQAAGAAAMAPAQPAFNQLATIYPDLALPSVDINVLVLGDVEIDGVGNVLALAA
jgi:hypothetical protein